MDKDEQTQSQHEIEMDFLGGNKHQNLINQMMHHVDMFPPGKQLAKYELLMVKGSPDLDRLCQNIAMAWEKAGGYVIFIAIRKVNGKTANDPQAYFMKGIHSITMKDEYTPLGWALFRDILKQLGYVTQTDENMHVTSISRN